MIISHISEAIGDTPLLRIDPAVHGIAGTEIFAKLEMLNPFGSLKDRIAKELLDENLADIRSSGMSVIESSSGNTAKALSALAGTYGISFKTVTNRIRIPEVKKILQVQGVELEELPGLSECPDPSDPNDPLAYIERMMAARPGAYYHTSQYTNRRNPEAHYRTTGKEIRDDLGSVDFLYGGVGTAGSTSGISAQLREENPDLAVIGVLADLGTQLPGIRNPDELHEVGIFNRSDYAELVKVDTQAAIDGMLTLIRSCGILCGPTSGATYGAMVRHLSTMPLPAEGTVRTAVFIVCDRLEWYISYLEKNRPSLFRTEPSPDSIRTLSPEEIERSASVHAPEAERLIAERSPLIIDIRGAVGFRANHIAGSFNIPEATLEDLLDGGMPFSPGTPVLLICPAGERSRRFAAFLTRRGLEAFSLSGGITGWRDAGLPLERGL